MKLHLLIDTCVWLDLAKDYRQLPVLDTLEAMIDAGEACLILPQIVVDEFVRNKDRVVADSKRSLASHFRLVREAVLKFGDEAGRAAALDHLNDVDHRIATGGEATNDTIDQIERLFERAELIETSDFIKARAADRAINKIAPFHRQRNGIDDAILIEIYAQALVDKKDEDDVCAFITHNIHDFSHKGGDARLPHNDILTLFDGTSSRYAINLAALLTEYADDLLGEIRFEREFTDEPRKLSQLHDAMQNLGRQVWYNRHLNLRAEIAQGAQRVVPRTEWEAASIEQRRTMISLDIWEGALAAAALSEQAVGVENLGPWTDFEWGMINGKLSAIGWVLGDEWDMLDS